MKLFRELLHSMIDYSQTFGKEGFSLLHGVTCCGTLILLLFLASCSSLEHPLRKSPKEIPPLQSPEEVAEPKIETDAADEQEAIALETIGPTIDHGTGEFLSAPERGEEAASAAGENDITLNFQDTDLREFIKVILSDVLGESFLIDPRVGGSVTIQTVAPVSRAQVMPIFEEILAMNGAAMVPSDGLYKIVPREAAVRGNLGPELAGAGTGYAANIIPLRFIAALEMQKILEPFLIDPAGLTIDSKRNLLIISGTSQEQELIRETVALFDVDWMRGMSTGLYPLTYVEPKTLKEELDAILQAVEGETTGNLLDGMVRTVALERLNAILIISSTPATQREMETWLQRLDKPGEYVGKRLYVYNAQNAKAIDLAEILGPVFSGDRATAVKRTAELAPGLQPVEVTKPAPEQNQQPGQQQQPQQPAARVYGGEGVSLPTDDSIQIIADDVRNALVILATPDDYKMVEAAIKKLDVVPMQVLIEASILEVTLRDDLNYGVEWYFKNHLPLNEGKTGISTLDLGAAGISAQVPSFSYVIKDAAGVNFALNALQNESDINVISSPSLMVLDNQTATINVGDEIPVPSRQSISNLDPNAPTVNEIQYRKTGVTLTVTPRVNSGGLVTMEITQEVSSAVSTTTSDIDAPTIQNRMVESVVAINSGDTIVLGGLIQDNESASESGIPGLYRIPLLGKLFGRTKNELSRTELLIMITPRVVGNRSEARAITNEFRAKLRSIAPSGSGSGSETIE